MGKGRKGVEWGGGGWQCGGVATWTDQLGLAGAGPGRPLVAAGAYREAEGQASPNPKETAASKSPGGLQHSLCQHCWVAVWEFGQDGAGICVPGAVRLIGAPASPTQWCPVSSDPSCCFTWASHFNSSNAPECHFCSKGTGAGHELWDRGEDHIFHCLPQEPCTALCVSFVGFAFPSREMNMKKSHNHG